MEDDKLIEMAKKGKSEAFGLLYDKYVSSIYRYLFLRVGGDKGLAEDLTHNVFLAAWKNMGNYEIRGVPFLSYLYRIAKNELTDYWRTKKTTIDIYDLSDSEAMSAKHDWGESLDEKQILEKIKNAIPLLEDSYQEVIILKFVEGFSNKEIAEMLGKSEGAIRVLQHRALKQLKSYLENLEKNDVI